MVVNYGVATKVQLLFGALQEEEVPSSARSNASGGGVLTFWG